MRDEKQDAGKKTPKMLTHKLKMLLVDFSKSFRKNKIPAKKKIPGKKC